MPDLQTPTNIATNTAISASPQRKKAVLVQGVGALAVTHFPAFLKLITKSKVLKLRILNWLKVQNRAEWPLTRNTALMLLSLKSN
jgi:hypothetical protein